MARKTTEQRQEGGGGGGPRQQTATNSSGNSGRSTNTNSGSSSVGHHANYQSMVDRVKENTTTVAAAAGAEGQEDYDPLATITTTTGAASALSAPPPTFPGNRRNAKNSSNLSYRGFATSIHDMFLSTTTTTTRDEGILPGDDDGMRGRSSRSSNSTNTERIDCCAITCCGILQSDRDRYLMTGIVPPSPLKRLTVHVFVPISIFFMAGVAAMRIQDTTSNQCVSTALIVLLVVYLVLQCNKGRNKRMQVRKSVLLAKYQLQLVRGGRGSGSGSKADCDYNDAIAFDILQQQQRSHDTNDDDDSTHERDYYLGQTQRDIRCAHPCCLVSLYAEDAQPGVGTDPEQLSSSPPPQCNHREDVCRCLYDTVCPGFCGMHVQCCGMCAIAQEGREIERTIFPAAAFASARYHYRQIDYVTMQPMLQYYPAIYEHRHSISDVTTSRPAALPTTSVPSSAAAASPEEGAEHSNTRSSAASSSSRKRTILGVPLSLMSYRLLQSLVGFVLLMFVWSLSGPYYWKHFIGRHGSKHIFRLPDFVLLLLTLLQSFAMLAVWRYFINRHKHSELSLDAMIKYFASGFFLCSSLSLFWELAASLVFTAFVQLLLALGGVDVMNDPESDQGYISIIFPGDAYLTTISSSPSLISKFYAANNAGAGVSRPDYAKLFGMDHPFLYTLYIFVATFIIAAFIEELCKYFGYRMVEHPDFFSREELEDAALHSRGHHYDHHQSNDDDEEDGTEGGLEGDHYRLAPAETRTDFSSQCQSVQAKGAAITLAMVSVAIGFSCCENLIYVFLYAGNTTQLELGVLLERSFFPVHPVLAAIQSIGVCRRDLEASREKLGRIIFPAVMFHGSFDFIIVFIAFIGKLVGEQVEEGDLQISNTAEFLSVLSCIVILFAGIYYVYTESSKQREHLIAIDRQATVDRSSLL
jgi:RsiW-degrading membrane proteinase PrsW (M82 family)